MGELPPDVPMDLSAVPYVQDLIVANNAAVKAKHRHNPLRLLNDALQRAAEAGLGPVLLAILDEVLGGRSSVSIKGEPLARVLYVLHGKPDLQAVGASIVQRLIARDFTPDSVEMTEKVVAVATRYCTTAGSGIDPRAVLALLPAAMLRRRVFGPLFDTAKDKLDCRLAEEILQCGLDAGIEFWDEDFLKLLECADGAASTALAVRVAEAMEASHPIVGKKNRDLFAKLFGGTEASVGDDGKCSACGHTLKAFDFSEAERRLLLQDVTDKLIVPRMQCVSHYEPNVPVTAAVLAERTARFEAFKIELASLPYTAIIDGANVGYYGLTNWYSTAKREKLQQQGRDLSKVPRSELETVPFPVDVPPKLQLVDQMVQRVVALGHRPLVLLHERHTRSAGPDGKVLADWKTNGRLLATPPFLNDDFCWLYAAARRQGCMVVTNDLMRDHHFSLLSQRAFLRWRQQHRITYKCLFNSVDKSAVLALRPPRSFAVWVQRAAGRWHFPVLMTAPVLVQATNTTVKLVGYKVEKDGDDECSAWLCAPAPCT